MYSFMLKGKSMVATGFEKAYLVFMTTYSNSGTICAKYNISEVLSVQLPRAAKKRKQGRPLHLEFMMVQLLQLFAAACCEPLAWMYSILLVLLYPVTY